MSQSVDISALLAITGEDKALQKQLMELFLESGDSCTEGLRQALAAKDNSAWKQAAHALKGVCYNLGAWPLGQLCKTAQEESEDSDETKKKILTDIEFEYENVRIFIENSIGHGLN